MARFNLNHNYYYLLQQLHFVASPLQRLFHARKKWNQQAPTSLLKFILSSPFLSISLPFPIPLADQSTKVSRSRSLLPQLTCYSSSEPSSHISAFLRYLLTERPYDTRTDLLGGIIIVTLGSWLAREEHARPSAQAPLAMTYVILRVLAPETTARDPDRHLLDMEGKQADFRRLTSFLSSSSLLCLRAR